MPDPGEFTAHVYSVWVRVADDDDHFALNKLIYMVAISEITRDTLQGLIFRIVSLKL